MERGVSIVGRIVRRVHHAPDNSDIVLKRCKLDNIGYIKGIKTLSFSF
jgi:hypothetical protein